MILSELQQRTLAALLPGPLTHLSLAGEIGEAPFMVRAELLELQRRHLVVLIHHVTKHNGVRAADAWLLTAAGLQAIVTRPREVRRAA